MNRKTKKTIISIKNPAKKFIKNVKTIINKNIIKATIYGLERPPIDIIIFRN